MVMTSPRKHQRICKRQGVPFINTLTEVFMQFAGTYHLLDIMTEVTRKLSAQSLTSADLRTVPCTTHMLTKKWFLNPPYIPA
nr:hypothetical protein BaRGS_027898 [Batillaria attramentaria]